MELIRSPLLMNRHDTALLIVDVQEKLVPYIHNHRRLLWNASRLVAGASALDVDIYVSEQYPQGLGSTVEPIATGLGEKFQDVCFEKKMFSCRECQSLWEQLVADSIRKVVVVGIETHVCVMQTALDLLAAGFEVYVCTDAVGSRFEHDSQTALSRLESSGATLVTTEMTLFEWCEHAGDEKFKTISSLVRKAFVD